MSAPANQTPGQEVIKQEPLPSQPQLPLSTHEHHSNGIIQKLPQQSVATLSANMPPPAAAAAAATALLKRKAETPAEDPAARQKELAALQEARQRELAAQQEMKRRFAQQHYVDKSRAIQPDYQTPFSSQQDILNRLLAYHVLYQQPELPKISEDWKAEYAKKALEISARIQKMKEPFERHVVRPAYSSREEGILLNKLQYFDDKIELDHLKSKMGLLPKTAPATPAAPRTPAPAPPMSSSQGQLVRTATPAVGTPQTRAAVAAATITAPQRTAPSTPTVAAKPPGGFSPPAVPPLKKPQPYVAPQPQPSPQPHAQPPAHAVNKLPPTPASVATLAAISSVALPTLPLAGTAHHTAASHQATSSSQSSAVVPKLPANANGLPPTGTQTTTAAPKHP